MFTGRKFNKTIIKHQLARIWTKNICLISYDKIFLPSWKDPLTKQRGGLFIIVNKVYNQIIGDYVRLKLNLLIYQKKGIFIGI